MKKRLIAVSLLAAIAGWMIFPPPKTAATQAKDEPVIELYDSIDSKMVPPAQVEIPSGPPKSTKPNNVTASPYNGRHYSKQEVIQLIKDHSAQFGISAEIPLRIAQCESGYNQFAKNETTTASGVFQYLSSTWRATDEGKIGLSVFNADANVRAAIKYLAFHKSTRPWNASRSCWSS